MSPRSNVLPKRGLAAIVAASMLLVGIAVHSLPAGAQTPTTTAVAQLAPVGGSGISGTLYFTDNGPTLSVSGNASGMQLFGQYVSLVYGLNSNADVTGQTPPGPCADDGTLGEGIFNQGGGSVLFSPVATTRMLLGAWPLVGTSRTLPVPWVKPTDSPGGVGLDEVRTVSIRQPVLPLLPNIFQDIRPQVFNLRACGLIQPTS